MSDAEVKAFLADGEDCCVEFYHDVGQLFPITSTAVDRVQPFHADPGDRSSQERRLFECKEVQSAVNKALEDQYAGAAPALLPVQETRNGNTHNTAGIPFSASELRNIQALLEAVGDGTASHMRARLQREGIQTSASQVHRQELKERHRRKRSRLPLPASHPDSLPITVRNRQGLTQERALGSPTPTPTPQACTTSSFVKTNERNGASSSESPDPEAPPDTSASAMQFVAPVDTDVLDVLRGEVFENTSAFVLSPVYQFIDVISAVVVENQSLTTTFPAPQALRQAPTSGFSPQRRVLLIPLTEEYDHRMGWMVPTEVDGAQLSMSLFVDDVSVALPQNWQLSPGKEAAAVKTSPAIDITELVMSSNQDLFSLRVQFSNTLDDVELWQGLIACVYVENIGLTKVGERIISLYQKDTSAARRSLRLSPRSTHDNVHITEGSVRVQCPITTLPMEIPVRSIHCEHLQCMEMAAVLIQCNRQNVWNCPLCSAPMKPSDIIVNYRLKEWLKGHQYDIPRVEYAIETAPGYPLKVVLAAEPPHRCSTVEIIDD